MTSPLYRRVLGSRFDGLPARVRELHDLRGRSVWVGVASVERGRSLVSRLAAAVSGLPPEGPDQPLRVTFEPAATSETWTRQFGSARPQLTTVGKVRFVEFCRRYSGE